MLYELWNVCINGSVQDCNTYFPIRWRYDSLALSHSSIDGLMQKVHKSIANDVSFALSHQYISFMFVKVNTRHTNHVWATAPIFDREHFSNHRISWSGNYSTLLVGLKPTTPRLHTECSNRTILFIYSFTYFKSPICRSVTAVWQNPTRIQQHRFTLSRDLR